MAIVTPRFTIGVTNYDLPHAEEYKLETDYTSVPLKMANGRTVWQVFAIEGGGGSPGYMYRVTVGWSHLTSAEKGVLATVLDDLRSGTYATFRAPDETSLLVTIDPDKPTWDFDAVWDRGVALFWRTTISLVQDKA